MAKSSDLLKLVLVIHFVNLCVSLPLSSEDFYDSSVYEPELTGYVPVATSLVAPQGYWHHRAHIPSYGERMKTWLAPRKRNSELINSLLGLPKNINEAGK